MKLLDKSKSFRTGIVLVLLLIAGCSSIDSASYEGVLIKHAASNKISPSNWCGVAVPVEVFRFAPKSGIREYYEKSWIRRNETKDGAFIGCKASVGNVNNWSDVIDYCEQKTQKVCQIAYVRSANPKSDQWYHYMDAVFAEVDEIFAVKSPTQPNVNTAETQSSTKPKVDLTNLTNSVMNGWRADYKNQMGRVIDSTSCSGSVNLKNLTDSVMNGWRADYKNQMSSLLNCTGCTGAVNLKNLTDSVMNGWRADYKNQMSSLLNCTGN